MKRRAVPASVKLRVALRQAGLDPDHVALDHDPPLALRAYDETTGKYTPDADDERHLTYLSTADHATKTFGTRVPLSGDLAKIAKAKRLSDDHAAFRAMLVGKLNGDPMPPVQRWPKGRPLRSRGFQQGRSR